MGCKSFLSFQRCINMISVLVHLKNTNNNGVIKVSYIGPTLRFVLQNTSKSNRLINCFDILK